MYLWMYIIIIVIFVIIRFNVMSSIAVNTKTAQNQAKAVGKAKADRMAQINQKRGFNSYIFMNYKQYSILCSFSHMHIYEQDCLPVVKLHPNKSKQ